MRVQSRRGTWAELVPVLTCPECGQSRPADHDCSEVAR